MVTKNGPLPQHFINRYMEGDATLDKIFGFRYENNNFEIINKTAQFQGDNIVINGEVYVGTASLWSLIADEIPKGYDDNDLELYIKSYCTKPMSYDVAMNHLVIIQERVNPRNGPTY